MAELLIKVGAGANFEDGDILCAFNRRRIRCCHAQHICHVRVAPRNGGGLIRTDAVARDWFEATHEYRFERVSPNELDRVTIATGERERLSDKPNAKGQAIDVRLFIVRRKRRPDNYLFGEDGAEIWYGGRIDVSHAKLDLVWQAIEAKSPHRENDEDFQVWPAGIQELKSHLFVPVVDFSDVEAEALVEPWTEPDPTAEDPDATRVVKKRNIGCNWRVAAVLDRLGVTEADVSDKSKSIDKRRGVAPLGDVLLLRNKKENRPGERITG